MTVLHVGAVIDRLPTHRYCEQLTYCEFAPRSPLPRIPTLRRWFYQRKYATHIGLVAPRQSFVSPNGAARLDALDPDSVSWLVQAAKALEATYILLPSGRDLTPSARDRQHLAAYCSHLTTESGRPVAWWPGGLWEPETAAVQAERMQIGLSLDVLEHPPQSTTTLFARVTGVGARARMGPGHLEQAVEAVCQSGAETAYLAVHADPPARKALAARRIAQQWAESDAKLQLAAPVRVPKDSHET